MASQRDGAGFEWAYRDLLIALLVVFMAMAALAIIAVAKKQNDSANQGMLIVQMTWPITINADVDLWVGAPGDRPVGYANRDAADCDLLRDDRGPAYDTNARNTEITVCRVIPDGEWAVDTMCYSSADNQFPIPVTVMLQFQQGGGLRTLLTKTVSLEYCQQEITVWRFTTRNKEIVAGSVNDLPIDLYGMTTIRNQ